MEMEDHGGFLRRSVWAGMALALCCLLTSALLARWDWFLGFLLGSSLSLFHFRLLVQSASKWFRGDGKVKGSDLWKGFFSRLLFTAGAMGLGILYLPLNLPALAIGLFVLQGGLLLNFALRGIKREEE
jgi:hypothetical protein